MTRSDEGRKVLKQVWERNLKTIRSSRLEVPPGITVFTPVAASFSYGLDESGEPADDRYLLNNFIAYLKIALGQETYRKYLPLDVPEASEQADGRAFGKPAWNFEYPESSFFFTEGGLTGCSISTTRPGDLVFVPCGSTYPFILRPDGGHFLIRGDAYVHGVMNGERWDEEEDLRTVNIH